MKLVLISDTHTKHNEIFLPEGDVLIHAGDFTNRGSRDDILLFMEWFFKQPHEYKIFIAGNHELSFENKPEWLNIVLANLPEKVFYLENTGVDINGVKFWGSPDTPWFYDWAFNKQRGEEIDQIWKRIPFDTDVLITHGPPFGKGDYIPTQQTYVGCENLSFRIKEIKPKLNVFGHIHPGYGVEFDEHTLYVNASQLNDNYHLVNKPIVVEFDIINKIVNYLENE